jgi:hypothetical protein
LRLQSAGKDGRANGNEQPSNHLHQYRRPGLHAPPKALPGSHNLSLLSLFVSIENDQTLYLASRSTIVAENIACQPKNLFTLSLSFN